MPDSYPGPAANLGPITEWVSQKAVGLTTGNMVGKTLGFQQTAVELVLLLHLHKL